jgi:NADPH-dependent glutamate synthase beta subunit-like oxidoreductase
MRPPRRDLTSAPDLKHDALAGALRRHRPVYVSLKPPCNHACPAGENIQGWLDKAQAGDFEAAWQILVADNPLPAVHGRVCYHPCEDHCNRQHVDQSVGIHAVERFIGDMAIEQDWKLPEPKAQSGRRVLVVGGGPSGLSAAYHLRRLGHAVEVREAGPLAGGMMHFGIPAYRLPRDVLEHEVRRIQDMGVDFLLEHPVADLREAIREGQFDAAFVAVGAHLAKRIDIPARDASGILDAVSFLKGVKNQSAPKLGRRVAIYGGGNTAIDAARVAKRLGAEEALIIYRRDRAHMPAREFEADEALEEGVKINWLRSIKAIDESRLTVEVMALDEHGKPRPTGKTETLEADALILALGQESDTEFLKSLPGLEFGRDGTVIVDSNMMTGCRGVFAGGDMVPSERTVTVAVGHGKHAARHIDAYLRNTVYERPPPHPLATHDKLRVAYYTDARQQDESRLPSEQRTSSFDEVVSSLDAGQARYEAQRCYSCGNCFECDGCLAACPEDAVIKLGRGKGYEYDYSRCTGCAVCFEQCPCYAIDLIPEPGTTSARDTHDDV